MPKRASECFTDTEAGSRSQGRNVKVIELFSSGSPDFAMTCWRFAESVKSIFACIASIHNESCLKEKLPSLLSQRLLLNHFMNPILHIFRNVETLFAILFSLSVLYSGSIELF